MLSLNQSDFLKKFNPKSIQSGYNIADLILELSFGTTRCARPNQVEWAES